MQTPRVHQTERRALVSVVLRALFGMALMCVSSLSIVQQRALVYQGEAEILEMRHDVPRVTVGTPAGNGALHDKADDLVACCRSRDGAAALLPGHTPRTGHRLSNGLVAPLLC